VRLVFIEWLDSFGCSSQWEDIAVPAPAPLFCRSVGWLLHDTDQCKVVVPHLTFPTQEHMKQQGCGDMTIPTRAILRIVDLPVPSESASAIAEGITKDGQPIPFGVAFLGKDSLSEKERIRAQILEDRARK